MPEMPSCSREKSVEIITTALKTVPDLKSFFNFMGHEPMQAIFDMEVLMILMSINDGFNRSQLLDHIGSTYDIVERLLKNHGAEIAKKALNGD